MDGQKQKRMAYTSAMKSVLLNIIENGENGAFREPFKEKDISKNLERMELWKKIHQLFIEVPVPTV
jgi:hypothetical protein